MKVDIQLKFWLLAILILFYSKNFERKQAMYDHLFLGITVQPTDFLFFLFFWGRFFPSPLTRLLVGYFLRFWNFDHDHDQIALAKKQKNLAFPPSLAWSGSLSQPSVTWYRYKSFLKVYTLVMTCLQKTRPLLFFSFSTMRTSTTFFHLLWLHCPWMYPTLYSSSAASDRED